MARFIKVSYTARIKDGRVFDTTDEKIAKDEKIFIDGKIYKPLPVVVGEGHLLKSLDEFLEGMKVNETKTVELPPEKAFGNRDPNLVRLVPMRIFKEQKITPIPGMLIQLDGRNARIQTVAGGRVRVDFNSDLAGKYVIYDIKIEDEAKTEEDKVLFLLERSFNSVEAFNVNIDGKKIKVELPEIAYKDRNILIRKASFAAEAFKILGVEEITYIEKWTNRKLEKSKEANATEKKEKQEQES
ncbi:MAG: peptidylprolyl isomerase [Candidatus Altiarchaeota archaeon]